MGLFDFLKKKEQKKEIEKPVLAMLMFDNKETYNLQKLIDALKDGWNIIATNIDGNNQVATFSIHGELVALGAVDGQIPWGDIATTAQYAYNWPTAENDLKNHSSHVLVTVMPGKQKQAEQFKILTQVISAILSTTNSLGVYQGAQSLLIPKAQYINSAAGLKEDKIPVDLWIYIGLKTNANGNNAYTYGLKSFNKLEMEFINASLDLEEIYMFLTNICDYVIENDIKFKNKETIGYSSEQKIKITESKGIFIDGQTLKLEL